MVSGFANDMPVRIALLADYPPRLCGIATFARDVRTALVQAFPSSVVEVFAVDDGLANYAYPPEVVRTIADRDIDAYASAAAVIDAEYDLLLVQHEFGIFGGPAGSHLLTLLDAVACPVLVTLHTVLEAPSPDQRRVMDALAARASRLIVMAEKGAEILHRVYAVAPADIVVVPHGVPDRPLIEPSVMKPRFGFGKRPVILTFGLLSPNKGIETMIRAMPAIVRANAAALYVVLGATHPNLVAQQGEAYRESLIALSVELGVADNVQFVDGFVETPLLLEYLAAADVYATPYLNEAQITSGTLSYAVAVGKPVVSTPYWHAAELLAGGVGVLVPFGDIDAFATAVGGLLENDANRESMRKRAWTVGRTMTWAKLAARYMAEVRAALTVPSVVAITSASTVPANIAPAPAFPRIAPTRPGLGAIERMTDSCGMMQHAVGLIPDRSHGYCVDDNARALMLMHRIEGADAGRADALAWDYAAFVQHAWNGDVGHFRNFMSYERRWLEPQGSEDSSARALWSLGLTAAEARAPKLQQWALALFTMAAPGLLRVGSPRAQAFCILAADAVLTVEGAHADALTIVETFGRALHARLGWASVPDWMWFETRLAYDNARLPQAMLRSAERLGDTGMRADALAALSWLCGVQTGTGGVYRAFGSTGFGQDGLRTALYDQQPVEAWATIDACLAAWIVTEDPAWRAEARRANAWFGGGNDIGLSLVDDDGGCFDGLTPTGVNRNQGAESILAYGHAAAALAKVDGAAMRAPTRTKLAAAR